MIVYYDPEKFNIVGMSHIVVPARQDPYFETDDPRALNIFLGKDKVSRYEVFFDPNDIKKGGLRVKGSNAVIKPINDRIYRIPNSPTSIPDVVIRQNKTTKSIAITITPSVISQLTLENKTIQLSACKPNDPYHMYWVKYITPDMLSSTVEFDYQGTDDFCFFTEKIFDFYQHEYS
jgi:hypothetical protein